MKADRAPDDDDDTVAVALPLDKVLELRALMREGWLTADVFVRAVMQLFDDLQDARGLKGDDAVMQKMARRAFGHDDAEAVAMREGLQELFRDLFAAIADWPQ
jgi:hypothetical protein